MAAGERALLYGLTALMLFSLIYVTDSAPPPENMRGFEVLLAAASFAVLGLIAGLGWPPRVFLGCAVLLQDIGVSILLGRAHALDPAYVSVQFMAAACLAALVFYADPAPWMQRWLAGATGVLGRAGRNAVYYLWATVLLWGIALAVLAGALAFGYLLSGHLVFFDDIKESGDLPQHTIAQAMGVFSLLLFVAFFAPSWVRALDRTAESS